LARERRRPVAFATSRAPYGSSAIWHPGDGGQNVGFAMSLDQLKQSDAELFAGGFRLVDLCTGFSA
jgi:hypothetical protein